MDGLLLLLASLDLIGSYGQMYQPGDFEEYLKRTQRLASGETEKKKVGGQLDLLEGIKSV